MNLRSYVRISVLSLLSLAALALMPTGPSAAVAEQTTISLGIWGAQVDVDNITNQVARYEELNPHVDVEIVRITGDMIQGYLTRIAGGVAPDVMYPGNWFLGEFAEQGFWLNLEPFIERDGLDLTQFAPSTVDAMQWGGIQWALPVGFHTEALYYNRNIFDAVGVAYPNGDWTWTEYRNAAKMLAEDSNGDGQPDTWGAYTDLWIPGFQPFLVQNGGNIISRDGLRSVIDSLESVEALQFIRDLIWEDNTFPSPAVLQQMPGPDMFQQGLLAMGNYGHWQVPRLINADVSFDWDVEVLPRNKYQASTVHVHGYAIYRDSKVPDAAWDLVKWMTTDGGVVLSDLVPAQIALASSPEFLGSQPANHVAFLEMAIWPMTDQPPFGPKFSQWAGILSSGLGKVWRNEEPVENVVGDIAGRITAILSE